MITQYNLLSSSGNTSIVLNNQFNDTKSAGKTVMFRGKSHRVGDLSEFDFSRVKVGLFSAGASVSKKYAPVAAALGCIVIDNTSHFRLEKDIPLIIPEVNSNALIDYQQRNIIANQRNKMSNRRNNIFN